MLFDWGHVEPLPTSSRRVRAEVEEVEDPESLHVA